eukprot:TRINITY_DN21252_c0_g1_i1.p1 TRINITY_DN21252_c0_g1~~TRINITY_DN21252_c0_g1_i1.p1  ORF type:complete len:134 (+),score=33.44 TRINITY_DN21252_c0_g1_i1:3-404(+)
MEGEHKQGVNQTLPSLTSKCSKFLEKAYECEEKHGNNSRLCDKYLALLSTCISHALCPKQVNDMLKCVEKVEPRKTREEGGGGETNSTSYELNYNYIVEALRRTDSECEQQKAAMDRCTKMNLLMVWETSKHL